MAPPSAPAPVTPPAATFDDGHIADAEQWLELVTRSGLNGPSRQLAANAAFIGHREGVLRLALAPGFEYLNPNVPSPILRRRWRRSWATRRAS